MKRWEPIKTEKKQLGGIIKLLQKVSPKLASKARGRLLASHLGQIKDLKSPYIFPGQLGWSPAETRTVWHRTNNPNFKVKRVFEGRWDAKEHGAPKNGLWVSEKKDIGFMNDRPILIQLQQILKKPMVQIGDIPAQGKNKLRNHILREAEQSGADAVKFQGIKDNKTSNQNVTFIFDPITSTIIPPKEMRAFKEQMTKLTPQQIRQEANEGVRDIMMWYRSPQWETRAASRGLTSDEIKAFQNLQGKVLSQKLPMSDRFGPVNVMVEDMGKGVQGYSQFLPKSIHTNQYPSEHFIAISNQASHPYYTAIHEGMHHGTFNIGSTGWATPQITLSPIEQNALDKVLRNAKALNDRLEIDPNKFTTLMNKLQTKYGMSEVEARHWIGDRVKYWQTPQESRARAGAVNQYKRNHPNASEEELTQIDNARQIFTNESLNNLYGKTIALGIPVVGALASNQLGNGE